MPIDQTLRGLALEIDASTRSVPRSPPAPRVSVHRSSQYPNDSGAYQGDTATQWWRSVGL